MAETWQQDTDETWTLRDDQGGILAAITDEGSGRFRVSGALYDDVEHFGSYDEAKVDVERKRDQQM